MLDIDAHWRIWGSFLAPQWSQEPDCVHTSVCKDHRLQNWPQRIFISGWTKESSEHLGSILSAVRHGTLVACCWRQGSWKVGGMQESGTPQEEGHV